MGVALAPAATPSPPLVDAVDAESENGRLVALVLAGYPVAWAVGLGPVVFPMAAFFMVIRLIRRRPLRIPPGTIMLALFLVLVLASVLQVNSPGRVGIWVLRTSWYASALVTWVYLARNTGEHSRRIIVWSLIATWAMTILGGYAAILLPDLSWSTPVAAVLPGALSGDEFVRDMIRPRLAEVQLFYPDIRLNRPAAPYAYTNAWGSSVALLTPFVLAALQDRRLRIPRWVVVLALLAGLVPFYYALNRGAWLTLGLGVLYGVARYSRVNRNLVPLATLAVLGVLGLAVATGTGVLNTAISQLETRSADSNETRANIYVETIQHSAESPLIGFGTPRTNPSNPSGPPLGTHGQLWAIMFAHGYVAVALYLGFFLFSFFRAQGRDPITHWSKVALGIGLLQIPIYGHLPTQLFIMVTAAAMAVWPSDSIGPAPAIAGRGSPAVPALEAGLS